MVDFHIKGLNKVKAKGRIYYYHRATRKRIRAEFGTSAFLAEVETLNCYGGTQGVDRRPHARGTLGALVTAYRSSPEFLGLASRTKAGYCSLSRWLSSLCRRPAIRRRSRKRV